VLLVLTLPALAQPKDAAELFPAQTLAYAEVRQPDKLSREVLALIRGSALEDLVAVFAKARTERGDTPDDFSYGRMMFSMMGVLISPEGVAEYGRLGGGAVAVTGWNKEDGPEVVGVVYPGDCNLFMMYMRGYLAADSEIRILDKVEGVNLYRARGRDYRKQAFGPGGAPPPQPPITDRGPTFALMPGLVVIASTPRAAREVVRRAKGKVADPALASLGTFKRAATLRDKPGAFAYADVSALAAQVDEATKGGKPNADWAAFQALVNPRGLGPATASLTLQNGNLDFRVQVQLDPKQPCPLLDVLPDKKATLDALHFAPKDGLLTLTVPWPDGQKRWEKVLTLLDLIARQQGEPEERLPSKALAAAEEKSGLNLGKDVFARVAGITLTVDLRGDRAKSGPPLLLALTATDADAAKALADALPKVVGLGGAGAAPPGVEKVEGLELLSFPAEALPWRAPLFCGREGKTLVLGATKDGVAESLLGGAKNGGLLGEAKVAAALKESDEALVIGTASLGQVLLEWMKLAEPAPIVNGGKVPPGVEPKPPKETPKVEAKFTRAMVQATEPLPPAVLTLSRKSDVLVLEMKQAALKTASAKIINVLIDRAVHDIMSPSGRFGAGGAAVPDAPVPPPKP
jgi:hypothetical protein